MGILLCALYSMLASATVVPRCAINAARKIEEEPQELPTMGKSKAETAPVSDLNVQLSDPGLFHRARAQKAK